MSKELQLKAAAIAVILLAALTAKASDSVAIGLVVFGIINIVLSAAGTMAVRAASIAATLVALVSPGDIRTVITVVAWLVWPPAMLVAWALARAREASEPDPPPALGDSARQARLSLAAIVGAVGMASVTYRLIVYNDYQQTAALFVGIPALLAIVVLLTVSPRSATGVACKAVTVGLLVSLIFLGEGMLCVLMSAPLFYAVAVVVGLIIDFARRRESRGASTTLSCLAILAMMPFTLEGVTELTTIARDSTATEMRIVDAPADAVQRALFAAPRFDRSLPIYLRAGFPRPTMTRIEPGPAGLRWSVRMRGGEMRIDGMEPRAGDLVLQLEESSPGLVRWRALSDDSHMTHFLRWRESTVSWEPVDEHRTKVTWTIRYSRELDPSWYFGWWEHYAAKLAAGYLITSVATP